ncbi:hypothetical protein [Chitinimonas naiadis]
MTEVNSFFELDASDHIGKLKDDGDRKQMEEACLLINSLLAKKSSAATIEGLIPNSRLTSCGDTADIILEVLSGPKSVDRVYKENNEGILHRYDASIPLNRGIYRFTSIHNRGNTGDHAFILVARGEEDNKKFDLYESNAYGRKNESSQEMEATSISFLPISNLFNKDPMKKDEAKKKQLSHTRTNLNEEEAKNLIKKMQDKNTLILGWNYFYVPPKPEIVDQENADQENADQENADQCCTIQ